jgi:hypothetical protein
MRYNDDETHLEKIKQILQHLPGFEVEFQQKFIRA